VLLVVGLSACASGNTLSAVNVTYHSAKLRASADCDGGDSGEWWFQLRPQGGAWQNASSKTNWICDASGQENVVLSRNVTNLSPSTTYQFLLVGHNEGTNPPGPPDGTAEPWYCGTVADTCDIERANVTPATFTTDPALGVTEIKGQLATAAEVQQVPVDAVRIIYGAGEAPYTAAKNHVQLLLDEGKLPLTVLQFVDWRDIPRQTWIDDVRTFVQNVPSPIIEMGNEPGTDICGGGPACDAEVKAVWDAYFVRLKDVSDIVHNAGKKLILGGNPPGGPAYLGAEAFLDRADAANIWPYVDGVGLHPYMPTPSQQYTYIYNRRQQLNNFDPPFTGPRSAFFLEFGWGSGGNPSPMNVGEAGQAEYLETAFTNLRANAGPGNLRIATASWFSWQDWVQNGGNWDRHAGVRYYGGGAKPSYTALQQFANP
jgi:hypothetical protein